tara:strand:- start:381 stop:860 length:480 start_codon:yes stop_codon:yes gene_type:complete
MNTIKNSISKNFTIIPNELINTDSLSDRSRFLFVFLACKPDDWKFYNKNLAESMGYSIESLRKYMNDLVHSGWVVKSTQPRVNGKFGTINYTLNAHPLQISPYGEKPDTVKNRHDKSPTHTKTNNYKEENKRKKDFFLKSDTKSTIPNKKDKNSRTPLK